MAELKSPTSEQPKSKVSFEVTMDNDEFEIKYKDIPTRAHISRWNCEVVPATFDLRIHRELYTIRGLPKTFADCLNVTLTSIRNRKQCLIFAFGHDTLVDAVEMVNKFVEVKETLLKFIRENYSKVKDMSLRCWVGEQNRSSEQDVKNIGETRNKSESVLFLAPGKSDGYKSETHWFCKLGQDEFEMDLTSSNATFTSLKHMLEDTYRCILKRVRRGSFIFECKHESRENAVKMMKDHAKVKDTILRCLHDMDPRVNAIRVDVEYREDHVEIDPPQLLETGYQAKGYVNKEEFDRIVAALQQKQSEQLEKLHELQQAQLAVTATETITDVSEDQFQATEDLSEAEGGHRHRGGVSKPRQKSESVIRLKRQLADLKQELKATTDRMHRLETTHKKAPGTDTGREPGSRDTPQGSDQPGGATPTPARRDHEADRDLRDASRKGNMAAVKLILGAGRADVNCRGGGGRTPVMAAALGGHRDVVELLVNEGADVSLVDKDGNNILHQACRGGDVETVKFVLSLHVVDINSRGWRSRTPVVSAALRRHRDVVEFLVSEGADVSLVDEYGDNILHLACMRGNLETVKFALSLNVVDIDARNNDGQKAADVARLLGHKKVVKLLEPPRCHVI
ncbi:uncharacterized protein LOC124127331 isoform X2 [Haliotis rufescens]|uniref:uncharacterized protein LOC124127331 isoform X2 n=1 Tax=Haliotis rufescens TaxID=6454 RepID=UPI00201E8407|nr:uncharacterized protein LOC124127331 isoform X2 [Haliotis rufescens]